MAQGRGTQGQGRRKGHLRFHPQASSGRPVKGGECGQGWSVTEGCVLRNVVEGLVTETVSKGG